MKIKENKSLFLKQFGDTPQLRVLDFLIDNYMFDFPMTEIARESNVSYNSLKIFFPEFVKSKVLVKTRKIGKSDYYKLNIENSFIKNLIKLDWILVKENSLVEERKELIQSIS
ncbi:hypothetical protein K8R33_01120 [archaeon]|nr:hypothetical protein [archaeon]